ncbi:hypothetical protein PCANB_000877 [Pneumocystis canis]|nr:hypothetical protein PCANB_000877 [Pneumocystis canis]
MSALPIIPKQNSLGLDRRETVIAMVIQTSTRGTVDSDICAAKLPSVGLWLNASKSESMPEAMIRVKVDGSVYFCLLIISNMSEGGSFADDLIEERGIVSSRVALLRSAEIKPLFPRFVQKKNISSRRFSKGRKIDLGSGKKRLEMT